MVQKPFTAHRKPIFRSWCWGAHRSCRRSGIQTSPVRSGMDSYNVVQCCVVLGGFAFPLWARVLMLGAYKFGMTCLWLVRQWFCCAPKMDLWCLKPIAFMYLPVLGYARPYIIILLWVWTPNDGFCCAFVFRYLFFARCQCNECVVRCGCFFSPFLPFRVTSYSSILCP
jgi:hypothetical protein